MGYNFAVLTIFIWSFWFVLSRLGLSDSVSFFPIDLVFFRHLFASIAILPFIYKIPIKRIGLFPCILISVCIGTMYNLLSLYGLVFFRSNHGAVVIAGFTLVFASFYSTAIKKIFF